MEENGEDKKQIVADLLKDIERYNPEHIPTLESYVEHQCCENTYDLEANLALLKLYQLNPSRYNVDSVCQILLKALMNLPHTDFVLCKCLLNAKRLAESPVDHITYIADILEHCDFREFWAKIHSKSELYVEIVGFLDAIRKFICHVVGISFQSLERSQLSLFLGGVDEPTLKQWIKKNNWKDANSGMVFIANQEEQIKTRNITESIDFDKVAAVMASMK